MIEDAVIEFSTKLKDVEAKQRLLIEAIQD